MKIDLGKLAAPAIAVGICAFGGSAIAFFCSHKPVPEFPDAAKGVRESIGNDILQKLLDSHLPKVDKMGLTPDTGMRLLPLSLNGDERRITYLVTDPVFGRATEVQGSVKPEEQGSSVELEFSLRLLASYSTENGKLTPPKSVVEGSILRGKIIGMCGAGGTCRNSTVVFRDEDIKAALGSEVDPSRVEIRRINPQQEPGLRNLESHAVNTGQMNEDPETARTALRERKILEAFDTNVLRTRTPNKWTSVVYVGDDVGKVELRILERKLDEKLQQVNFSVELRKADGSVFKENGVWRFSESRVGMYEEIHPYQGFEEGLEVEIGGVRRKIIKATDGQIEEFKTEKANKEKAEAEAKKDVKS
jgi:hypothetical protein